MTKRIRPLRFGALPSHTINRTLDHLNLADGEVLMSGKAQAHASNRHPKDFPICLPHIGAVIADPDYIGDDKKNTGKIELISTIKPVGLSILVAVLIKPDNYGNYHIVSFYPVSESKIGSRLSRGFLKIAK